MSYPTDFLVKEPKTELNYFFNLLIDNIPFYFIRFSDGETEILHNRYLEIRNCETEFKGKVIKTTYKELDYKKFDPEINEDFRNDLLESAKFRKNNFYKGIPTRHNNAIEDTELMIQLNGGSLTNLTFSDLFLNSNYLRFRKLVLNYLLKRKSGYIIGNYRSKLIGPLSDFDLLTIPDNVFSDYHKYLELHLEILCNSPKGTLILSSASSYTNIIGYYLYSIRPDLTFIDIGTSLNDYLSLPLNTRFYHCLLDNGIKGLYRKIKYITSDNYKLLW
jgi:hypothetical protein